MRFSHLGYQRRGGRLGCSSHIPAGILQSGKRSWFRPKAGLGSSTFIGGSIASAVFCGRTIPKEWIPAFAGMTTPCPRSSAFISGSSLSSLRSSASSAVEPQRHFLAFFASIAVLISMRDFSPPCFARWGMLRILCLVRGAEKTAERHKQAFS